MLSIPKGPQGNAWGSQFIVFHALKGIANGAVCHPKKEVQGDLFATPELFSASAPSGGFSEVVMDPPWVTKSRGARYATPSYQAT